MEVRDPVRYACVVAISLTLVTGVVPLGVATSPGQTDAPDEADARPGLDLFDDRALSGEAGPVPPAFDHLLDRPDDRRLDGPPVRAEQIPPLAEPEADRARDAVGIGVDPVELEAAIEGLEDASAGSRAPIDLPFPAQGTAQPGDCVPHPPIRITEEQGPQGFILGHDPVTGEPIHRPGSGVTAGDGTEEDPYVIERWCIVAARTPYYGLATGIWIEGTDAHVMIRDNVVRGSPVSGTSADGVRLQEAENVTVRSNTIEDTGGIGVFLAVAQSNRIHDNTIRGHSGDVLSAAVLAYGSDRNRISGNTIEDSAAGIGLVFADGNIVGGNEIDGNTLGIALVEAQRNILDLNRLSDNEHGIRLYESRTNNIASNFLTDHAGSAILLASSTGNRLAWNSVVGNHGNGVFLTASSGNNTIEDNSLTRNSRAGIESLGSHGNALRDNTLDRNGVAGVLVRSANGTEITGNIVTSPPEGPAVGVALISSSDSRLEDNTISDMGLGVYLGRSSSNILQDNILVDGSTGLQLFLSDDNTIVGHTVEDHDWDAIELRGSSGNLVADTTITGNHDAISAYASSRDNTFARNTIVDNDDDAVSLRGSSGNTTFTDNVVEDNGDGALSVYWSGGNSFTGNVFEGNRRGVSLYRSPGNTFAGNTFRGEGVLLVGREVEHYRQGFHGTSNTVNGEPLRYVEGTDDVQVPAPAGQVIVVDADNVTVQGLNLSDTAVGVTAVFSRNVTVDGATMEANDLAGALFDHADGSTVTGSVVRGNGLVGVVVYRSNGTVLADSTIADQERLSHGGYGAYLYGAPEATVEGNAFDGNGLVGLVVYWSDGNRIRDNTFTDNGVLGLGLARSSGASFANNTVSDTGDPGTEGSAFGVILYGTNGTDLVGNTVTGTAGQGVFVQGISYRDVPAEDTRIEANDVTDNAVGLRFAGETPGTLVRDNNIDGSWDGIGLNATAAEVRVDARDNWWGCPGGPDAAGCDDVVGNATYTPWRTSPNADAGAS